MDNEKIKEYITNLKKLEKVIKDEEEDTDLNFINDLNVLLGKLDEDIKTDFYNPKGMGVKIKKLNQNAVIPTYAKEGDAGMDLTITSVISETETDITYGFGIAMEIPKGYVGLIFPRSSIRKYNLLLTNSVGVIDQGFRGEIQATFKKTVASDSLKYNVGERGAQIMLLPYPQIEFIESSELSDSERGDGGFGSTGS